MKCLLLTKFLLLLSLSFTLLACEKLFPPSPYTCENQPEHFKNIEEHSVSLFVIWANKNTNLLAAQQEIITQVQTLNQQPFKIWLRDNSINNFTLSDKTHEFSGVISAVLSISETNPTRLLEIKNLLAPYGVHIAIYAAQQSIPLAYQKNWQSGEVTPALISMSFFQKPAGMNSTEFKNYWFCAHTPFAIDIHPLWHYERNAVRQLLTEGSPTYDGIVPLYLKNDADLTFSNFFSADNNNALFNALRIQSDVKNFINLDVIETVAMREFVID